MTFLMTPTMNSYVRLQRTWAAKASDSKVPELYEQSCQKDFDSIRKALPRRSAGEVKILDIGAGLGGIDVLLHNYYYLAGCDPKIWVLDKEETTKKIKYGFSNNPSAYNSLKTTRNFFEANGVKNSVFTEAFPQNIQFDIIISLISYGFHYPLSEYISYVKKAVHKKTIIVFDIRKNSGQFDALHNAFDWANCLMVTEKYKRMVCRP